MVADYFLRYDYYSSVLCVNKAKPELKCNGKCHLALQKQEDNEQNTPLPELRVFEFFAAQYLEAQESAAKELEFSYTFNFPYVNSLPQTGVILRLLRPPQLNLHRYLV